MDSNKQTKYWIEPHSEFEYDLKKGYSKKRRYAKDCILCYQEEFINIAKKRHGAKKVDNLLGCDYYTFYRSNKEMGIIKTGIGAPMTTLILERLIVRQVKFILNVGIVGSLQYENTPIGSLVLCTKSLRHEGTSKYYIPQSKFAYPNKQFTQKIEFILKNRNINYLKGANLTIDAPYRLSINKCKELNLQNILTSDMEAAAVFAVTKYRKVSSAALFVISDNTNKNFLWNPGFHQRSLKKGISLLFDIAVASFK